MIKLTFCLRRLPSLSRAEFQTYWFETHAPLVASVKDALRIRRYVQLHSLPAETSAGLRTARAGPEGYDGVAQLWWDSFEDMATNDRRPPRRAACCWRTSASSSTCPTPRSGGARRR